MESKRYSHAAALGTALLIALFAGQYAFGMGFDRVSTFYNYTNNSDRNEETVSEIVDATPSGNLLIYTDGETGRIGFVDIRRPKAPMPLGTLNVGGEPTSVAIVNERYAIVGVNTSRSFLEPSGHLSVVDIQSRSVVREMDLGGQPDAIDVSPNRRYAAVAIENERDEDITVNGVEGGLPQLPAGFLVIVDLRGGPEQWGLRQVGLAGLSEYAPTDPEPEFVSINHNDRAAITLQENNHVVIVNLRNGKIVRDFGLGSVDLVNIDATEDDIISQTESLDAVAREPDAITWLPGGRLVATANEGDLFGGSRGFSIYTAFGKLRYDTGAGFDQLAAQYGHYPENRSENKGSEPEAITSARFGARDYLFVGSERGSFVAVYDVTGQRQTNPKFLQLLPAPLGPEGLLTIPDRQLLIVSGEADDPEFGVRSTIMIYQLGDRRPTYPDVISAETADGTPIPWSALSGMTSAGSNRLLAVNDSFYADSSIFRLRRGPRALEVQEKTPIIGGSGDFDPEGIALAPDNTYWIASEGNRSGSRPNRLLQTDTQGVVLQEVMLPEAVTACREASSNQGSHSGGFEGVAIWPGESASDVNGYTLVIAQQRGWDFTTADCEAMDDDQLGLDGDEPRATQLRLYSPGTGAWNSIAWELEEIPENASWVGLSEVTALADGGLLVLERDNRTGNFASLKTLVYVTADALADGSVTSSEKQVIDLLPAMRRSKGLVSDKPEGVAISGGRVFVVTDNDGVDDWSGETSVLRLGPLGALLKSATARQLQ